MKIEGKTQIWKEYQKEIPDNDFFYVRSCIRQNLFPASEVIFLKILREELKKNVTKHHITPLVAGSAIIPILFR